MLVYRDGKRFVRLPERARDLERALEAWAPLRALLLAGELEGALFDIGHADAARFATLTDQVARAMVTGERPEGARAWLPVPVPAVTVPVSSPEGFAYYALYPLDYARAALDAVPAGEAAWVLGIRSIGSVLSAIVAASLRERGQPVLRSTVRPKGHPFARHLEPDAALKECARWAASRGGWVVVVDEGPGISGSSFLAVAEAVIACGVSRSALIIIGSREFDPAGLVVNDAVARFAGLRRRVAPAESARPPDAGRDLSGGDWRALLCPASRWPAVWPQVERRKYLSADATHILKFEGLGGYGDEVRERSGHIAAEGLGPEVRDVGGGYAAYRLLAGRPMCAGDEPPLEAMARLIALRGRLFARDQVAVDALAEMVRTNVRELTGREVKVELPIERPAIVDGRIGPHEWIRAERLVSKTDSAAHGDDHFFPGPCDVAWDLAGAHVEWHLDPSERDALISSYERQSGDRQVRRRLSHWTLAYLAFRAAYLQMARDASAGGPEHARLSRAASHMLRRLRRQLVAPND